MESEISVDRLENSLAGQAPKARRKFKKTIILQALKKQPFIGFLPGQFRAGYANDEACCTLSEATFSWRFELAPVDQEAQPAPILVRADIHRTDRFADIEGDAEIPIRLRHRRAVKSSFQKKRAAVNLLDAMANRLPVD